jgi:tetratricopeptide (TPR) repeat protein
MDNNLQQHSFLDSYAKMQYVELTKTCAIFYPQNSLTYIKKDLDLLNEAVKIQPLYTRYWIYLGAYESTLAGQEADAAKRSDLIKLANDDFTTALRLAPKHQEIFIDLANLHIISGDYKSAEDYSQKGISLNSNFGECYFYLGLSQIYMKDSLNANQNIKTASTKGYNINSEDNLGKLGSAYNSIPDYQNLLIIFERLVSINPSDVQYHSSLAFIYAKLGEYDEARQEAAIVLQLSPQSKPNIDAFLKTLP